MLEMIRALPDAKLEWPMLVITSASALTRQAPLEVCGRGWCCGTTGTTYLKSNRRGLLLTTSAECENEMKN